MKVFKICLKTILVVLLVSLLTFFPKQINLFNSKKVFAASVEWIGGSGNWEDGANWSTGVVPTYSDDVLIDITGITVTLNSGVEVSSLVLGNVAGTSTISFNFNYDAVGTDSPLLVSGGDMYIYTGVTVTHTAGTSVVVGSIDIDVSNGDMYVYGSIDTKGKGYSSANGTGAGIGGSYYYGGSGGGYGGAGGKSYEREGGVSYGDVSNPIDLGSGGGTGRVSTVAGGSGGGLIHVTVSGNLTLDGNISADGNPGIIGGETGGGGSGGGIKLVISDILGTGDVTSNGGTAANEGGGGSGGRIYISSDLTNFEGTVSSLGGLCTTQNGSAGTILLKEPSSNGVVIINNVGATNSYENSARTYLGTTEEYNFDSIEIKNYGVLMLTTSVSITNELDIDATSTLVVGLDSNIEYGTINYAGTVVDQGGDIPILNGSIDLNVPAGAKLYADYPRSFNSGTIVGTVTNTLNSTSKTYYIDYSFSNNLDISATGVIDLKGRGYIAGQGLGKGVNGAYYGAGSGAGHAGVGGNSKEGKIGGSIYEDISTASDLGSGGGSGRQGAFLGGSGGGYIKLNIGNLLTIDGTIDVSGNSTSTSLTYGGGGGSGGTIDITAKDIAGSGSLLAVGGGSKNGGGGSGGYIKILYEADISESLTINYAGGTVTAPATNGGEGILSSVQYNPPHSVFSTLSSLSDFYAGKTYTFETVYSDADGYSDLVNMYLTLDNPDGTDISYSIPYEVAEEESITPTAISGSDYVTFANTDIQYGTPTTNDITVYWYLTLDWDWTESNNIEIGVNATDTDSYESGYIYTNNNYKYENDLAFEGTLTATGSVNGSLSTNSWIQATETIAWTGVKVVYEGTTDIYPNDLDFDVKLMDDAGNIYSDETSSGENISITSTSKSVPDTTYTNTLSIINIPSGGSNVAPLTLNLKIDNSTPDIGTLTGPNNDIAQNTSNSVTLTWSNPNSTSGNTYYITKDGTEPTTSNYQYTTTEPTYTLTSLPEGTTNIKVRPINGVKKYGTTKTYIFKYDITPPSNVSNIVGQSTTNTINISWTNPTTDFSKVIVKGSNGSTIYEGTNESLTINNLTANTNYTYKFVTQDSVGNTSSEQTFSKSTNPNPVVQTQTNTVLEIVEEEIPETVTPTQENQTITINNVKQTISQANTKTQIAIYADEEFEIKIPEELVKSSTTQTQQTVYISIGNEEYEMEYHPLEKVYKTTVKISQVSSSVLGAEVYTKDGDEKSSVLSMDLSVKSYSYVYESVKGKELRVNDAKVTLYKKINGKKILYVGENQDNPQTTNEKGEFRYIVEEGTYQIEVEAKGYRKTVTDWFEVNDGAISKDIELRSFVNWVYVGSALISISLFSFTVFKLRSKRLK